MNREIQRERYRNMGKDREREVVSVVVVVVGGGVTWTILRNSSVFQMFLYHTHTCRVNTYKERSSSKKTVTNLCTD